jgi:flagellar FliL protein
MSEANETPTAEPQSASPAKKSRKLLLFVVLATVLLGAGLAGWGLLPRPVVSSTTTEGEAQGMPKGTVHLESFIVNLADEGESCFLRVSMDLGVDRELQERKGEVKDRNEAPTARIRDTILLVLSSYRSDELLTTEGRAKLKADLVQALNRDVPDLKVRTVYFTEFLVQR